MEYEGSLYWNFWTGEVCLVVKVGYVVVVFCVVVIGSCMDRERSVDVSTPIVRQHRILEFYRLYVVCVIVVGIPLEKL